jgi:taurine transport system substrate-binding protein
MARPDFPSLGRNLWAALGLAAAGCLAQPAASSAEELTFAHQEMVLPLRVMMASGALEKATGYKINWRRFGAGGDVIRAMASGSVQIGEVGSSPIAAAASQGVDLKLFWILDEIVDAEQLVVRDGSGVTRLEELRGKTVAVPFVSTAHFQLITALKGVGLDQKDVKILNMRPPEIAAAWERGDIDATFVWDPVLTKVKQGGSVLTTAGQISAAGAPTFDGLVVEPGWAERHRDFLVQLVRMIAAEDEAYRSGKWDAGSPEAKAIAKATGSAAADVPASLASYRFLTLEAQASPKWLGGGAAKALTETARFLKAQGRIQTLAPDYAKFVTDEYVAAARK